MLEPNAESIKVNRTEELLAQIREEITKIEKRLAFYLRKISAEKPEVERVQEASELNEALGDILGRLEDLSERIIL